MGYMKDEKGVRLDDIRIPAEGDAHRHVHAMAVSKRSSPYNLVTGQTDPAAISWDLAAVDTTGAMHSGSAQTRLTVPAGAGGLWKVRARVAFPTGTGGTVREVFIRRYIKLTGFTSTEVARLSVAPTGVARPQYLDVESLPFYALAGDYFEVRYYHDVGSTQQMVQGNSHFQAERIGDARGKWDDVTFSADFGHRGDWSRYTASGGSFIEPVGLTVAPDPLDPSRTVGKIRCTIDNDSVLYPRVQAQTGTFLTPGLWYIGVSVFIPQDTHDRLAAAAHGLNIHELYGPPFGGAAPWVLQYNPTTGLNIQANLAGTAGSGVVQTRLWGSVDQGVPIVGKWIDVLVGVNLAATTAGYLQLWIDQGDGAGMVAQTLSDGTTSGTTFNMVTLAAAVNGTGNQFSSLKVSWAAGSALQEATVYIGDIRVGTTRSVISERASYVSVY